LCVKRCPRALQLDLGKGTRMQENREKAKGQKSGEREQRKREAEDEMKRGE